MTRLPPLALMNRRLAQRLSGRRLSRLQVRFLVELTRSFQFSLTAGDLILLDGRWYATHSGLLGLARRQRCAGIHVQPVPAFCDASAHRWAFAATVYKSKTCRGFVGYGDADPSNVSALVHGAEMRVAETRAVNRALRKAYGIGICSVEEIGSFAEPAQSSRESKKLPPQPCQRQWEQRRPEGSRPPLPDYSPASTRSQPGQGLRHRLLRRQDASRCHSRAGGKLRHAPGRLGRKGPQCPALPAQQLSRPERRCRMKRQITGLHAADRCAADQIPDGVFLVRVQRVQFRRQAQKPYYTLALAILEPSRFAGHILSSRLYCSPKALWKLNWFLRDFGYDTELLGRDEVDETQLVGLKGVVKISHIVFNGASLLRLDGFAPAGRWEELSPANLDSPQVA